jgi:hypothetical protein
MEESDYRDKSCLGLSELVRYVGLHGEEQQAACVTV